MLIDLIKNDHNTIPLTTKEICGEGTRTLVEIKFNMRNACQESRQTNEQNKRAKFPLVRWLADCYAHTLILPLHEHPIDSTHPSNLYSIRKYYHTHISPNNFVYNIDNRSRTTFHFCSILINEHS